MAGNDEGLRIGHNLPIKSIRRGDSPRRRERRIQTQSGRIPHRIRQKHMEVQNEFRSNG